MVAWEGGKNEWESGPTAPTDSAWGTDNAAGGGGDDWTGGDTDAGNGRDKPQAADSTFGNGNDDFNAGGEGGGNSGDRPPNGPCRRCNEEGHWAKECPNAPPMTCRECDSPDHVVKDCPERVCKNCGQKGHTVSACESARFVDRSTYPDMTIEEAWNVILEGVKERDIDDIKTGVQIYVKASPEATYVQLEEAFRSQGVDLWLIAIEKGGLAATMTNMDLQGNMEKKYTVTYRFQWLPPRPRDREAWPKDVAENLERLTDAGEVVPRGLPKCSNCNELGHISKSCTQDKNEPDTVRTIMCYNCDQPGHRMRDCPTPRVDKFACKNCGQSGHQVSECTEPRSADNVECRKCNEMGHFSKDCPKGGGNGCRNCGQEGHVAKECTEPKNMANVQCRNCDEMGHFSKECPKPRDITRVKCSNCQQMGHYKSKCQNPLVDEDTVADGGFDNAGGDSGFNNGGGDSGFDNGGGDGGDWNAGNSGGGGGAW